MQKLPVTHLYTKIFQSAVVAIGITDLDGNYILVNPAWCIFTGYDEEEARTLKVGDLTHPEDKDQSNKVYARLIAGEIASIRKTRRYLRKDGTAFWADLHVSSLTDDDGRVIGVIGVFVDIDRQVKAEQQQKELNRELTRLARHDSLTGLYNRRALEEIIQRELKRANRYKRGFAIALADVDNFKAINDTYGHDCGDEVLKHMAEIFRDSIRDTDSVGRWGGEEFLFIFSETSCQGAQVVAERIRSRLDDNAFLCNGNSFRIGITIGFSYHHGQIDVDEIIREADRALYLGKRNGKNQVVCYQEDCENLT